MEPGVILPSLLFRTIYMLNLRRKAFISREKSTPPDVWFHQLIDIKTCFQNKRGLKEKYVYRFMVLSILEIHQSWNTRKV
jgi:hypothetical protein